MDLAHKIFTVILAIVTAAIGARQFDLKHELEIERADLQAQIERTALVDRLLNRFETYLEKHSTTITERAKTINKSASISKDNTLHDEEKGFSNKDKARILISLNKIATDIHLSEKEKDNKGKQNNLIKQIPLLFALLSENADMLTAIGSDSDEMALWVKLAKEIADPDVKKTAATALERILFLTTDGNLHALVINNLIDLAADWQDETIRLSVGPALLKAVQRIETDDRLDNSDLRESIKQAQKILIQLKLKEIRTTEQIAEAREETKPDTSLQSDALTKLELNSSVVTAVRAATKRTATELNRDDQIRNLIEKLKSKDKNTRRSARTELASLGNPATSEMLASLQSQGDFYRIRLGVVTALLLMEQPVALEPEKVQFVTDLLGDADSTIRKNTANFLIALNDKNTQQVVVDRIVDGLSDLGNDNKIYNSVVVLGEYSKITPPVNRQKIRESLTILYHKLEIDSRDWSKTRNLIKKYIDNM